MKDVSVALETALGQNLTFLCRLWVITRKGGTVHRFTDHDVNITYEGNIYYASTSFQASAIQTSVNSASANMDVQILLDAGSIEYIDMERGMYDEAPVSLYMVNYKDLLAGHVDLFEGTVQTVALPNQQVATLALVGSVSKTNKPLNEFYSATCRAAFGDARCKVNLAPYTVAFTIDAVPTNLSFTASELAAAAANLYLLGIVEWLTGDNTGTKVEVRGNAAGTVGILAKPPFPMQVGDTGNIIRGCPKTVAACIAYGNLPNYRGEPYVPGDDGLRL